MKCLLIVLNLCYLAACNNIQRGYREQDFPYQVYIVSHINGSNKNCLGALISPNYILTTGSCTHKSQLISIILNAEHVENNVLECRGGCAQIHPDYVAKSGNYDVALIKLPQSLKFKSKKNFPIVKLPKLVDYFKSLTGHMATVSQAIENVQKYVPTTIISSTKCQKFYGPFFDENTKFCLSSEEMRPVSLEELDSVIDGSLLTVQSKSDGHPVLIGISAKGNRLGKIRTTEYPGVFTKLVKVLPWIYNNSDVNLQ